MQVEITREYIDQVEEAIERKDSEFILSTMADMYPADITTVLYELNANESKYVMDMLPPEVGSEILSNLDYDIRTDFLQYFTSAEIARYINLMHSDDAVDILNEQSVQTREEVIALIENEEKAEDILDLLHYEEDCAGGLMAKELIKVNLNWRVRQCIEEIRRQAEDVERIYTVYVVDNKDILVGRVSVKALLLSRDDKLVQDIYSTDVISIESFRDENEVVSVMQKYDLEAIPVVNIQGRLLGRITIDDVVDVMQEQAELSRQLMTGISENVEEDDSVFRISRSRIPWLIIGMVGGLMAAKFMGLFEKDIAILPALALFVPLITATGGNVGIQSSSIIIQTLSSNEVMFDNFAQRMFKLIMVALLNAIIISSLVFAFTYLSWQDLKLSLVVSVALFSVVILASMMGTLTPMVLDKVGINPAVAAGPFITTANDLLGLAIYFGVAHLLYNL
ncbi:magnesium transporter [Pontibacter sp. BT310]|uniref:Magnesium transporter MgtE n=1 Tax=Pontibacter populi TaxID=890055 RepID=A0ABS6XDR6_9BACT|nr:MULTISPECIES: magnesium transporter [Pontibacter]MBJ6118491.1 magnesium transporter [Pontibacter sp. BT310]MBR0570920.1 magnesium transporter [Microvirga sp. STS03]MBW3365345.1 magnesium transporter [Pontibacter populi]